MQLAIIIPVYNEAKLAPLLLERLLRTPPPGLPIDTDEPEASHARVRLTRRIYVIDDGSTDATAEALARIATSAEAHGSITLLRHTQNQGKGAAVRTGLEAAMRNNADLILIQDADLEYDPRDHARVLEPMLDGRADAVVGTRFGGEAHRVLYFWHYLANRFITLCSNVFTNLNLSDVECCLKAFSAEVASQLNLRENRFGIEPELVAKLARARVRSPGHAASLAHSSGTPSTLRPARVFEVAVSYAGRTYAEGKKIKPRDGLAALWCIVRYGFASGTR
ncbi:MAG: glycosyltransferase family 2 protein [Phycisphaerales bacterium]|nr:glycosyltransferase family 2 protein [Phycisphaerales bacterium]